MNSALQTSRPMYESEYDLEEEIKIISIVSRKFKCSFSKLPLRYSLDYAIVRDGNVVAFCEMKSRTNNMGKYDTYILSLGKVISARSMYQNTNLPCLLIVKWSDAIGYIDLMSEFSLKIGGRSDRSDWQDNEPVAHFKTSSFRMITDLS